MLDFTQNDLYVRAALDDRRRSVESIWRREPETRQCSVRSGIAARLAAWAVALDDEVARRRINGQSAAGRRA